MDDVDCSRITCSFCTTTLLQVDYSIEKGAQCINMRTIAEYFIGNSHSMKKLYRSLETSNAL